jgi:hypothetical protein
MTCDDCCEEHSSTLKTETAIVLEHLFAAMMLVEVVDLFFVA